MMQTARVASPPANAAAASAAAPLPQFNDVPQDAREAGEDDIEAILAEILNKEAKQTAVSD